MVKVDNEFSSNVRLAQHIWTVERVQTAEAKTVRSTLKEMKSPLEGG